MQDRLVEEIKKFGLLYDSLSEWQLQDIYKAVLKYLGNTNSTQWDVFEDGNLPPHGRSVLFYFPNQKMQCIGTCFHDDPYNLFGIPIWFERPSHWANLPINPQKPE